MARQIIFFVVLILGLLLSPLLAAKPMKVRLKRTPFGIGTEAGHGALKYHDTCVSFSAILISGDYFKDLYINKTPTTVEFRRKNEKQSYVNFPESLLVDVWASPNDCKGLPPDYAKTLPDYDSRIPDGAVGLMSGASFQVAWKRGDETRLLGLLATQQHYDNLRGIWSYLLTVPSKNVPLTDSLIIDISLQNGVCQTQLTANLDDRLRPLIPSTCH